MEKPSEGLSSWVGLVKDAVEIIALIAAGLWAYQKYGAFEAPSLEERASIETRLEWTDMPDSTRCIGAFGVTVRNIGKRPIEIDSTRVRVWLVPAPTMSSTITHLDPDSLQVGQPTFERAYYRANGPDNSTQEGVIGHYPPDIARYDDYVFALKRDRSKMAVFRFDAVGKASSGGGKRIVAHELQWEYNCSSSSRSDAATGPPQ